MWGISSILLIVTGIVCFCSPAGTLSGLSVFLGIMLLLSGIGSIISYCTTRKFVLGAGWILIEGILTSLLGIFALCNTTFVAGSLPIMAGMWIIILGIIRIISSFDMKKLMFKGWWIDIIWGALLIVLGVLSFFQPIINVIIITVFTGLFLVLSGISMLVNLYFACKLEKRAKRFIDQYNSIVVEPIDVKNIDIEQ